MRKSISLLVLAACISLPALADQSGAVVGGLFGAAAGAAIGSHGGGRDGAVVGAAIGGALGAAIGADNGRREVVVSRPYYQYSQPTYGYVPPQRVIYAPPMPVREVIVEDRWHHRGWDHEAWHRWHDSHDHYHDWRHG